MKYVLIKYKGLKLLINDGLHTQPLIDNLLAIESLAEKVNDFYANLMTATKQQGEALEKEKQALTSKIGYKIIGVPFTNHDAELYALDKKLDYEVLELHGMAGRANATKEIKKESQIHMRVTTEQKAFWVKEAMKNKMKLTEWITAKCNNKLK